MEAPPPKFHGRRDIRCYTEDVTPSSFALSGTFLKRYTACSKCVRTLRCRPGCRRQQANARPACTTLADRPWTRKIQVKAVTRRFTDQQAEHYGSSLDHERPLRGLLDRRPNAPTITVRITAPSYGPQGPMASKDLS